MPRRRAWRSDAPASLDRGWEAALERFLDGWRGRPYVHGAILFGSRVQGIARRHSDVDVHLVLANTIAWRERGTQVIDGYVVEYFATPARTYRRLHEARLCQNWRGVPRMLAHGRVLFDRTGAVTKIRAWAQRELKSRLTVSPPAERETAKYFMWDGLDGLVDLDARSSPSFWHQYHLVLDRTIRDYGKAIGAEAVAPIRRLDHFTSARFRRAYRIAPYPDRRFAALAAACVRAREPRAALLRLRRLIAHAHQHLGGFAVDGWSVRSRAP